MPPSPTTNSEAAALLLDSSGPVSPSADSTESLSVIPSIWQTYLQSQERKLILPVSAVHSRASVEFLVHKLASQQPNDLVLVLDSDGQEEETADMSFFAEQVIPRSFVQRVSLVSPHKFVWSASGQALPVLRALRTCRTLQELHLQGPIRPLVASQFGYALKEVLRSPVVQLTRLGLDGLGEDFAKIAAEVGQGIQQCSTLKVLELSRCTVTPTFLRKLTYTRCRLAVLIFRDCQVPGADLAEAIRARQSREELQAILTQVVHHQDQLHVLDLSSLVAVQSSETNDHFQRKQRPHHYPRPVSALAMNSALKQALWAHPTLQVVNVCATLHVQDPHVTALVDLYRAVAVVRRLHRRRARSAPPSQHQQVWIKPRPPPQSKKDQGTDGCVHLIVTPCDASTDDSAILATLVPRDDGEHEAQYELQRLVLHQARVLGQASGGQVRQVLELAAGDHKEGLKKLAFVECDMNAAALTEIHNGPLSALETLSFRRCSGLDEDMLQRWLWPNTNIHLPLRHLTLCQMKLSASILSTFTAYLQQNTLLQSLNVSANPQLLYTPASAAVVRRRALGQVLPAVDVETRSDFFTAVASHPTLHTFAVSPTPGTGWHPSHHDTLVALRALFETLAQHTATSQWRELDLSSGVGCELDSGWVSQLSKLQTLRVLRLPRPLPRDNSRVALLITALKQHLGLTELTWGEPHNHIYSQGTYEERMALKRILRRNWLIQLAAEIDDFNMLPAVWPRILARLAACGDGSAVFGVVRTHRSWYPVGQRQ